MRRSGLSPVSITLILAAGLIVSSSAIFAHPGENNGHGHKKYQQDEEYSHSHEYGHEHEYEHENEHEHEHEHEYAHGHRHGYASDGLTVRIEVGHFFTVEQRGFARDYYGRRFHQGHCPPGLAKKHNGCMPPGQARKWGIGQRLPDDVTTYPVSRVVVDALGRPPEGYRYVRVARDILLVAVGTHVVVDAIEDLGR